MDDLITLSFTEEELKRVIMDYTGVEEDYFDIDDYDDEYIKQMLLER